MWVKALGELIFSALNGSIPIPAILPLANCITLTSAIGSADWQSRFVARAWAVYGRVIDDPYFAVFFFYRLSAGESEPKLRSSENKVDRWCSAGEIHDLLPSTAKADRCLGAPST